MKPPYAVLALALVLAACGRPTPADNAADQLENAAEQSDPAAAAVLDNEADAIRDNGAAVGGSSDPDGPVQQAMKNAGEAQALNSQ